MKTWFRFRSRSCVSDRMVEATYAGPVAESYPTQGVADRIVILDRNRAMP